MSRKSVKSLEDQLNIANQELSKAEQSVINAKNKIKEIEFQIRERDKESVFVIIEKYGITTEKVISLLNKNVQNLNKQLTK